MKEVFGNNANIYLNRQKSEVGIIFFLLKQYPCLKKQTVSSIDKTVIKSNLSLT